MVARTPTSQLREAIDAVLHRDGTSLDDFLAAELADGHNPEIIAQHLYGKTSLSVSYRTVYRWLEDLDEPAPEAASTA